MKIGDKVHCTKYVERRRQGISVVDCSPFFDFVSDDVPRREVVYFDTEKNKTASIPYDEFEEVTVDKFKTIEQEFDGVYVGTTRLATKLWAILEEWGGGGYINFRSRDFEKFAVVYYANNRKRLVPVDCMKGVTDEKSSN